MRALTRVIATIGPASGGADTLDALIAAGVSTFRLNLSHGGVEGHVAAIAAIRAAEARAKTTVAILVDLPGPKIRLAGVPADGIALVAGGLVRLRGGDRSEAAAGAGAEPILACTYAGIVDDAEPGHRVLIDDGTIRLLVLERRGAELIATTLVGGVAKPSKGVNLPDSMVRTDPITQRDRDGVRCGLEQGADFLAMSFVQSADDLRRLRDLVQRLGGEVQRPSARLPQIVAKIERPQAVAEMAAIVDSADAIMVARGDLGVEMDLAKVPVVQKRLIAVARAAGKPSIVATQMLQSMVELPVPTRAEASDVANAILDGCDAVMLSGETAVGKWPVIAVETTLRIAREAEALQAPTLGYAVAPERLVRERNRIAALAHGAMRAARDLGVAGIATWSETGLTALLLSRYGFAVPIHAASVHAEALRSTSILRGIEPIPLERPPTSFIDFVETLERRLLADHRLRVGDLCIFVSGESFDGGPPSATMSVREIGLAGPEAGR